MKPEKKDFNGYFKKAQVNLLIGVIIVLIAAFLLFMFFSRFEDVAKGLRADFGCTLRVISSERAKFFGADTLPALCKPDFNVLIPTNTINLLPQSIRIKASRNEKIKRIFNVRSDKELLEKLSLLYLISLQIRKCWYKMGSGRFNLFGEWPLIDQRFCEVCAINVPLGFSLDAVTYPDIYNFVRIFQNDDKFLRDVYEIIKSNYNVYFDDYHLQCPKSKIKDVYSHQILLKNNFYVVFMKHNLNYVLKKLRLIYFGLSDLFNVVKDELKDISSGIIILENLKDNINDEKLKENTEKLFFIFKSFNDDDCKKKINNIFESMKNVIDNTKDKELNLKLEKLLDDLNAFKSDKCIGSEFLYSLIYNLFFGTEIEKQESLVIINSPITKLKDKLDLTTYEDLENKIKDVSFAFENEKLADLINYYGMRLNTLKAKCEKLPEKLRNEINLNCDDFTDFNHLTILRMRDQLKIYYKESEKSEVLLYLFDFKDKMINEMISSHNEEVFNLILDNYGCVNDDEFCFDYFNDKWRIVITQLWMPLFELEAYYKAMIYGLWIKRKEFDECKILEKENHLKTTMLMRRMGYLSGLVVGNNDTISQVCDYFIIP